jgi:hypothetical protein
MYIYEANRCGGATNGPPVTIPAMRAFVKLLEDEVTDHLGLAGPIVIVLHCSSV